nr:hypothetical protein [uncultured Methanoregula sp.]
MHKTGLFVLLLVTAGFLFCAGCMLQKSQDSPVVNTSQITPQPVNTSVNVTVATKTPVKPTPVVKKNTTVPTPNATPDPVDLSRINFTRYSDNDLSLDYPSSWNVSTSTYTSYNCVGTEKNPCYTKEIRSIGPFDFYEDDHMKKISRIVTFTSADKKQKIVAFTSDYGDNFVGNYQLDPSLDWCRKLVTKNFRDVAESVVGDYHYFVSGGIMVSDYSVTMPKGSAAYPLAYTMKNWVTLHHEYHVAFISDNANIEKYRDLKDRILSSVTPNDRV